jgi:hypothetical protein
MNSLKKIVKNSFNKNLNILINSDATHYNIGILNNYNKKVKTRQMANQNIISHE